MAARMHCSCAAATYVHYSMVLLGEGENAGKTRVEDAKMLEIPKILLYYFRNTSHPYCS
jgi:BRCT domain type II-containing protein